MLVKHNAKGEKKEVGLVCVVGSTGPLSPINTRKIHGIVYNDVSVL